jgi:acetyl-CoA C-acetyltransferase
VAAGAGQIPARQVALAAGIPLSVGAMCVNKMCASGMRAVTLADQMIRSGDRKLVVAAGMESMTNAPFLLAGARQGLRMGDTVARDAVLHDGLVDTWDGSHMIEFGGRMARRYAISRDEMDAWALSSHRRAVDAREALAADEIVAAGELDRDEGPRESASAEGLAALPPLGDAGVTAGNASPLSDGAAAVVLADEAYAASAGLEPIARIVSSAQVAGERPELASLPAVAAERALEKAGTRPDELRRVEVNEAFASVAVNVSRMLGVDPDRVNVRGGAIALGHPIGASGARITGSLAVQLRETGGRGLACICSAGGQGDAIVLEAM